AGSRLPPPGAASPGHSRTSTRPGRRAPVAWDAPRDRGGLGRSHGPRPLGPGAWPVGHGRRRPARTPRSTSDEPWLIPGERLLGGCRRKAANLRTDMGSLIKKRRKRMRKKKHKKMLKATRWQRRAAGKETHPSREGPAPGPRRPP